MKVTDFGAFARVYQGEEGLTEFRVETLKLLATAIVGLAFAVPWVSAVASLGSPRELVPAAVGLGAAAGIAYWALRFGPVVSAVVLTCGLTAMLTVLLFLYPGTFLAGNFCLVVLAASGVLDWRAGLWTAIVSSGILLAVAALAPAVLSPEATIQAQTLVWLTLLLAWLSARPLRTVVGWAWGSYALAQEKTEEARLRQAELVRLSKSLSDTCDKLERLNQELHEAREAAETARRLKAEFAATVAHELRTPVNLILGLSSMMSSKRRASYYDEPLPESYRDDVEAISRNGAHISSLVDDILDLSQVDAHRMVLRKERISLRQVAEEAAGNVEALYADAGLRLSIEVPPDVPRVSADSVRVRQVLINLLYNAVRFTHSGGVTVGARDSDADVVVTVTDTGVGIPPEDLPRLFEEYHQSRSPFRGTGGSGFGLAVCKRFVEFHGGSIWAESRPGTGTTVSFSLPRHDNVAVTAYRRPPVPGAHRDRARPSVAVLDPSGDAARILQRYLDNYHVRRLTSLEQAVQLADDGELHVLTVTSSDAQQAWHEFQRGHPRVQDVPTLMCPVRTRETIARDLGTTAYLVKPVSRDDLARALRRIGTSLRSLVVIEDDVEMRRLLVRMVRSLSRRCRVAEASDGETGLQLIRDLKPDIVVLDLLLPGLDGHGVLHALHHDEALRRVPVVVVSARGTEEQAVAPMIGVSRHDGLSVREVVACLRANVETLVRPNRDPEQEA